MIFGNMIYQSLQGISGNFTGYNQSIVLTANNYTTGSIFEASVADNTAQTVGSNCFRTTWFTAPYSFNATIDADTSLVVVSAAINTEPTNVLSYLLDFNSTDSYFYTSACRQEEGSPSRRRCSAAASLPEPLAREAACAADSSKALSSAALGVGRMRTLRRR